MFLLQLCILKTHTLRGNSTHYSIPRAVLQFSEYHGIKVWMYLGTFSWTVLTTDKWALRPTKWSTNQETKAANSTLFQFHLQKKSNPILLCKAHLTTGNTLDFHETQTEHSLNVTLKHGEYLGIFNNWQHPSCFYLQCRPWAGESVSTSCSTFCSQCLRQGLNYGLSPQPTLKALSLQQMAPCLLVSPVDTTALREKKYE